MEPSALRVPLTRMLAPAFSAVHATSSNLVDAVVVNFVVPTVLEIAGHVPVIEPSAPLTSTSLSLSLGGSFSGPSIWMRSACTNPVCCVPWTSTIAPFFRSANVFGTLLSPAIVVVASPFTSDPPSVNWNDEPVPVRPAIVPLNSASRGGLGAGGFGAGGFGAGGFGEG